MTAIWRRKSFRVLAFLAAMMTGAGLATRAHAQSDTTASIATAIVQGDEIALMQISRGAIWFNLEPGEARARGGTRATAGALISLLQGCRPDDLDEPAGGNDPSGSGGVTFICEDRSAASDPCRNVSYGLEIRPMPGYFRLVVWDFFDTWSHARCGIPPIPSVPPPSTPRPSNR